MGGYTPRATGKGPPSHDPEPPVPCWPGKRAGVRGEATRHLCIQAVPPHSTPAPLPMRRANPVWLDPFCRNLELAAQAEHEDDLPENLSEIADLWNSPTRTHVSRGQSCGAGGCSHSPVCMYTCVRAVYVCSSSGSLPRELLGVNRQQPSLTMTDTCGQPSRSMTTLPSWARSFGRDPSR